MNTSSIISVVVGLGLALIPDKADTTKRGYKGNTLKYCIWAIIALTE